MANANIDASMAAVDGEDPAAPDNAQDYVPLYQVYPNSKIPVSKSMGKFWEMRKKECWSLLKNSKAIDRWDEAIRYYQNDQSAKVGSRSELAQVSTGEQKKTRSSTENIVFANISALVPAVYAKNPEVEITPTDEGEEKQAGMYQALVDALFHSKSSPGVNLKGKMKQLTVLSMLTNVGYLELSYTQKQDSSEEAMTEIEGLSTDLQNAKTTTEIREIEGKLMALDSKVSMLGASGPKLRVRQPDMVLLDPNMDDTTSFEDASFIMVGDYIRTEFMRAVYGKKDSNGQWLSIYDPTHIVEAASTNIAGQDEQIQNFTLIDNTAEHKKYGYNDEDEYNNAARTKVWYVWDKVTRRVLMFNDKDWSMPIWVWDDPYHLTRFFPVFPLAFYTDPTDRYGRSEVMYYLDQQDEINIINHERARMRHWVSTKVFVNTNVIKDSTRVQNFLFDNTNEHVLGLALPENTDVSKAIGTIATPSTAFEKLFDTHPMLETINRISSVTPVLQNAQFKTNTTNKAIESYESSTQTRLDEKIDAIEDMLGELGQALLEMCVQFMDAETVTNLIGEKKVADGGGWTAPMAPQQFKNQFNFQIVGGSTLKPTSKVKRDQAIQLGQVLGQFASGTPAIIVVMLKVFERAFNEDFVITDDDWSLLMQGVNASIQAQQGGPPQQGGQQAPPQQGKQPAQQGMPVHPAAQQDILNQGAQQLEEFIDKLPPQVKGQVGKMLEKNVPLKQIISQVMQEVQQAQQGQQQQPAPPQQETNNAR